MSFEKIGEYEKKIIQSYENYSILPHACNLVPVPEGYELGTFSKFANRIAIEKEILLHEPGIINLGSLGIDIAHAETNEIVHQITTKSPPKEIDQEVSRDFLKEAIISQRDLGFNPQFMFVPIDYFMNMWNWSLVKFRRADFDGQGGYYWTIDDHTTVKIKYSNKRSPFDNFIITDPTYNIWQYRTDEKTGGRVTASFDTKSDSINAYLLIQTIFKFTATNPKANLVLKFKKEEST